MLRLDERYSMLVGLVAAVGGVPVGCTTRAVRCDSTHPSEAHSDQPAPAPAHSSVETIRAAWLFARRQAAAPNGAATLVEEARRELVRQGWVATGPEGAYVVAVAPGPHSADEKAGWGLWVVVDGTASDATPFALGLELARRARAGSGGGPRAVVVAVRGARVDAGPLASPPEMLWVGLGPWKGPPRPPVALLWGTPAQRGTATTLVRALLDRGVTTLNGQGAQVPVQGVAALGRLDVLVAPAEGEDAAALDGRVKLIEAMTGALLTLGAQHGDKP